MAGSPGPFDRNSPSYLVRVEDEGFAVESGDEVEGGGLRFTVGFQVSGFRFQFQVTGFRFQVSGFRSGYGSRLEVPVTLAQDVPVPWYEFHLGVRG